MILSNIVKLVSVIFILGMNSAVAAMHLNNQNNNYNATIWYRESAEKNALYREIFQLSKPALFNAKKQDVKSGTQCGVVFDIDETLLDNSWYGYHNMKNNTTYNDHSWDKFLNDEVSTALPGAKDITAYVHSIGCTVNLVSNRDIHSLKVTEDVLQSQGIYYDQILLAEKSYHGDKNSRFEAIEKGVPPSKFNYKQTIIAYYGDNIQDFYHSEQNKFAEKNMSSSDYQNFGIHYFVLPNPMYGSWVK